MVKRARTPEARIRRYIDQALELIGELERDDAIFMLGRLDGRLSHALHALKAGAPEEELEEEEGEETPPRIDPDREREAAAAGEASGVASQRRDDVSSIVGT